MKRPPLEDVLSALADPTRRRAVELIGRRPRRASELAEELGASRPAMSRHLRVLREAGVVREEADEDDGRAALLTLDRDAFTGIHGWLDEVESFWTDQLTSFKTTVEARARSQAEEQARSARSNKRRAS